jgi:hypothetical protein
MVAVAKKPKITGQELAALWDDYIAKRKRYLRTCRSRNGLDRPDMMPAHDDAQAAFEVVYRAMLSAAGCKKNVAAFTVTLPDGRTLVSIPNDIGDISDEWAQLHCVDVGWAVKLLS